MTLQPMTRGAIAAGNTQTAAAGAEMLRQGGNVFDAIVAAALAACVVEPTLTSLAGGGFLLAHTQAGEDILFDFFTQTPRKMRDRQEVDFYPVSVNFGNALQEFHIGMGAIATPGSAAGLFHVHRRLGRLPMSVVAAPAIHLARTGIPLEAFQVYCFHILTPIVLASAEMREICAPTGTLSPPGTLMRIPALAETLTRLVEQGVEEFYTGEIGRQLAKDCETSGGYLTLEDLQHYRVVERQPLRTTYRGNTLLTNPPPSSGGMLIAFALKLLETVDLRAMGFGSAAHLEAIAQTMRQTNLARAAAVLNHATTDTQSFLSAENLLPYTQALNKWGSTTHISAMDAEGNAASLTTSNGEGSAYMIPGTGVMTNNMLGEADLHPAGFQQWQPDVRIASMMSPTLLLRNHQPEIVLGSGGSNRIRTAILQVICNLLDFQMNVDDAVNYPRIHWENNVFNLEPGFNTPLSDPHQNLKRPTTESAAFPFDQEVILWDAPNMFFGGVHTVLRGASGEISGAGDRRRSGAIAVV